MVRGVERATGLYRQNLEALSYMSTIEGPNINVKIKVIQATGLLAQDEWDDKESSSDPFAGEINKAKHHYVRTCKSERFSSMSYPRSFLVFSSFLLFFFSFQFNTLLSPITDKKSFCFEGFI